MRYYCNSYIKAKFVNSKLTIESSAGEGFLFLFKHSGSQGRCVNSWGRGRSSPVVAHIAKLFPGSRDPQFRHQCCPCVDLDPIFFPFPVRTGGWHSGSGGSRDTVEGTCVPAAPPPAGHRRGGCALGFSRLACTDFPVLHSIRPRFQMCKVH